MKQRITLEDGPWVLDYHGTYCKDHYKVIENSDLAIMGEKPIQEIIIPEKIFQNLLVKLLRADKHLMLRVLETLVEELKNPSKICEGCKEQILISNNPCSTCLNRGYL